MRVHSMMTHSFPVIFYSPLCFTSYESSYPLVWERDPLIQHFLIAVHRPTPLPLSTNHSHLLLGIARIVTTSYGEENRWGWKQTLSAFPISHLYHQWLITHHLSSLVVETSTKTGSNGSPLEERYLKG